MLNNFSIFCDISLSKCHKMVNTDSSGGITQQAIPWTNIYHSLLQGQKLGKISTGPTYKLILSFTGISDLYRLSIWNQTIFTWECSPGALKFTE